MPLLLTKIIISYYFGVIVDEISQNLIDLVQTSEVILWQIQLIDRNRSRIQHFRLVFLYDSCCCSNCVLNAILVFEAPPT